MPRPQKKIKKNTNYWSPLPSSFISPTYILNSHYGHDQRLNLDDLGTSPRTAERQLGIAISGPDALPHSGRSREPSQGRMPSVRKPQMEIVKFAFHRRIEYAVDPGLRERPTPSGKSHPGSRTPGGFRRPERRPVVSMPSRESRPLRAGRAIGAIRKYCIDIDDFFR